MRPGRHLSKDSGEVYLEVLVVTLSVGKAEENHQDGQDGQDGQMGTGSGRRTERSLDPDRRASSY